MAVQLSEASKKMAIQNYIVEVKAIPLAFEVQLYCAYPDYLTARAQNWYKRYGFNSEQEFESFWSKYGNKVKLKWLQASAADFPSYEEYVRQAELASVKLTLAHGTGEVFPQRNADIAYKPILRVTTVDGRTWDFDLTRNEDLPPRRAFYNILRLASSPLVTSIETISTSNPKAFGGGQFELFTEWIISNRIPLILDKLPNITGFDHPPLWPPPYSGTLTGGTTTGGTATGSTTTGSTTTGGTTTTEGTTTTAVVKSALPYVAIGAGVLLLLWAMKK